MENQEPTKFILCHGTFQELPDLLMNEHVFKAMIQFIAKKDKRDFESEEFTIRVVQDFIRNAFIEHKSFEWRSHPALIHAFYESKQEHESELYGIFDDYELYECSLDESEYEIQSDYSDQYGYQESIVYCGNKLKRIEFVESF